MRPYKRMFSSLVITMVLLFFSGCSSGSGSSTTSSSNWDQLIWDQGNWQ